MNGSCDRCSQSSRGDPDGQGGEPARAALDRYAGDVPLGDERWCDWPRCPQCGRRRPTVCPTCELGGDDFVLAEFIPAAAPLESTRPDTEAAELDGSHAADSVLLMCPVCDEAFAPRFYRLCPDCGHDFGDGVEIPPDGADVLSGRAVLVLIALALLTLAALGYFWYIFQ